MTLSSRPGTDALSPEDSPPQPDKLGDVKRPSWLYVLRRTMREFSRDQCTDLAAALTYFARSARAGPCGICAG